MNGGLLSLFMDILVLLCLGGTIYYVLRLSKNLNAFREYRDEFGILIQELSQNINIAQSAISNLKIAGSKSEESLRELLKESSYLADELQLMNETGNNLAQRLESLAQKNSQLAQEQKIKHTTNHDFYDEPQDTYQDTYYDDGLNRTKAHKNGSESPPSFFIQDRDHNSKDYDETDFETEKHFSSQAERELFEALQKSRKSSGIG